MLERDDMGETQRGAAHHFKTVFETRTFFSFHVREEALQPLMPPGWSVMPCRDGPDQGANVRFGMTSQFAAVAPDGSPVEATRFCPLTVTSRRVAGRDQDTYRIAIAYWSSASTSEPMRWSAVRQSATGATEREADRIEIEHETRRAGPGHSAGRQRWSFASGRREVAAEISWEGTEQVHGTETFWVMSPALGEAYRRYQIEKVEEIVMSAPLGVDRSTSRSFRAAGAGLSELFDGSHTLVSVIVQSFGRREIYLY